VKSLKILQIIPHFKWEFGGPVRSVFELSSCLASIGNDVTVFCTSIGDGGRITERDFPENLLEEHLGKVKVAYFDCDYNWPADRLGIHLSNSLRHAIDTSIEEFDIVHLHEWRGTPNLYAWQSSRRHETRYILQAHGSSPLVIGKQGPITILSKILFDMSVGRRIVHDASGFVALTTAEAKQYMRAGAPMERIEVLPNGIDSREFKILPKRGEFRRQYSIKDDEKVVLYLGRIHKNKGIDILIDSFVQVTKSVQGCRLVIVGPDDGYLSALRDMVDRLHARNCIDFIGPLFGIDRIRAYVDSDVFVLPSLYEAFGRTIIEATACGTYVIVSDRCGLAEFVQRTAIGKVVSLDTGSFRDAIIQALCDRSGRIGPNRAKEIVMAEFDWREITKKMEALYKKCQ
jgi:glycosyltransferase involved in cell wall biosynthesis